MCESGHFTTLNSQKIPCRAPTHRIHNTLSIDSTYKRTHTQCYVIVRLERGRFFEVSESTWLHSHVAECWNIVGFHLVVVAMWDWSGVQMRLSFSLWSLCEMLYLNLNILFNNLYQSLNIQSSLNSTGTIHNKSAVLSLYGIYVQKLNKNSSKTLNNEKK